MLNCALYGVRDWWVRWISSPSLAGNGVSQKEEIKVMLTHGCIALSQRMNLTVGKFDENCSFWMLRLKIWQFVAFTQSAAVNIARFFLFVYKQMEQLLLHRTRELLSYSVVKGFLPGYFKWGQFTGVNCTNIWENRSWKSDTIQRSWTRVSLVVYIMNVVVIC